MNLENFATTPQDELITWANEKANDFADGTLDLTDEASAPSDDLIYALAIYKLLAEQNLAVKNAGYKTFITEAEAELRRRNNA